MTKRPEIRESPKQTLVAAVRHAMIDIGRRLAALTHRLPAQHKGANRAPARGVVPLTDVGIRAGVIAKRIVPAAVPARHLRLTARP